jgi:hypothetical protein
LLIAVVAINSTAIDAPRRSDSAIVRDYPESMQAQSGEPRHAVVGRPIVSKARAFQAERLWEIDAGDDLMITELRLAS